MNNNKKIELLSPAGSYEKLKFAVEYGADAVYFAGKNYSLRAKSTNFELDEIEEAMKYLHSRGKFGYCAVNIFAHNDDFAGMQDYVKNLEAVGVDAFIVADPGVFHLIKSSGVKTPLHISTQANVTNIMAVKFWEQMGAERVVLARELEKEEIEHICKNTNMEIEVFAHGAMCMAMSGRCMISNYVTGRDANKGECTQSCRWNYKVSLTPENREVDFPIEEDEHGVYFFNTKDLNLIRRVGDLIKIGVKSLKIEGRMKSIMYVSAITGAYRKAIDLALLNPDEYVADDELIDILNSVSNRTYTEGFFGGDYSTDSMNYETSGYVREAAFLGVIERDYNGEAVVKVKSAFNKGDKISILTPGIDIKHIIVDNIVDVRNGEIVERTKPNFYYKFDGIQDIREYSLLREEFAKQ